MPIELNEINMIEKHELIIDALSTIKLIVMDLDGTVLDHADDYTEEIHELSKLCSKLSRLNIDSMVATGRTLAGSRQIINKLISNKNIPIITYNGSLVIHNENNNVLDQKFINDNSIQEIISICQDYGELKVFSYYFEDHIVSHKEYVRGWTLGERNEVEFNQQVVFWVDKICDLQINDNFPSAMLIDISQLSETKDVIDAIVKIKNISVTSSGDTYIEIRPKDSDKGNALEVVSNYLKIEKNEILTIGDNDNDVEMLAYSGVGISMSNASYSAKSVSMFIASRGAFEGVLEVLRLVHEINRIKRKSHDV